MYKTTATVVFLLLLSCGTQGNAEAEPENFSISTDEVQAFDDMFGTGLQEEDVYRTDRLLLSATGSLKPIHLAPSVASVITAEDIERLGATTLDEVLETVPGLHVSRSFARLDSIYSIRGIHSGSNPQVLVLMNDVPFTRAHSGTRPVGFRLPVSMISRIEVVRGPGSALYGADAFAGTINIITKDKFELEGTHTGMRVATFDGMDVWAQHGGEYKGWDVGLGLEYWRGGSDDKRIIDADLQTKLDRAFGTDASLAPGPLHTDFENYNLHAEFSRKQWTVRLWGWFLSDYEGGTGGIGALGPETRVNSDLILGDITWHDDELVDDVDLTVQMSYQYHKDDTLFQLLPSGSRVTIGTDGNIFSSPTAGITTFTDGAFGEPYPVEHHASFDVIAKYEGWNRHSWRIAAGGDALDETTRELKNLGPGVLNDSSLSDSTDGTLTDVTGTEGIFMSDQSRSVLYGSLQDEWVFAKNWELTGGVRYDHYNDFGDTVNPRIALVWETRYDLSTKLMYGHAFRPPSFAENYLKNNPLVLGNPDLDPETIDTYELAFDYRPTNSLKTVISLFTYDIEGLIDYVADPAPVTTKTAQNYINQQGHGFEVELEWEVTPTLMVSSNFAFQYSENKDTGAEVADAPGLQFYLNGNWNFMPDWYLNAQYYWIDNRQRAEGDERKEIDDYSLANMILRRKNVTQHIDLAFSVRNIFDEDIREPASPSIPNDIPMESRGMYAELIYHF
ncbi:MAG: TonB-dependent receptor [Candidatus Electrothrix scaldis]|nr:MAG: TonB-dependent receptor [Candidatus Electrothrix sp. GW3-3]